MKLIFLGTRGYVDAHSRRHRWHSSLLIRHQEKSVMIDCGLDWLGKVERLVGWPDAIVITHAHPDHADGLKDGAPCPVYATKESWHVMRNFSIDKKRILKPYRATTIAGITFKTFPVEHSFRAPAVGYRVTANNASFFYAPDLISIIKQKEALARVLVYIGDGSTISQPIIRMHDGKQKGHTTIKNQLRWCHKENVPRAIFTHCGLQIVEGDERVLVPKIRAFANELGVEVVIAHDCMELLL